MVLADTSVWISHLHGVNPRMSELLRRDEIAIHRLVLGELACGSLQPRDEILEMLSELPESRAASHDEVLDFIEHKQLWGVGLSYVDVHLLASALLSKIPLWTKDKHLRAAADALGVSYG